MIGGHNSACSYAQAIDHLGAAKDIDDMFKHHPDLDLGHHRLELTQHEGVDHINHEIWQGDIIVGQCDLPVAWHMGAEAALSILSMSKIDPAHYSFTEFFNNSIIDMLHPFGQNKYLSITTEEEFEDVSHIPELPPPNPITPALQHLETVSAPAEDHEIRVYRDLLEGDEEELMLTFQEALIDESPANEPSAASSSQLLTADPLAPPLPQGPGIHPEDYLLYNGYWIHKKTICRLMVNKDFVSKSLNLLERIIQKSTNALIYLQVISQTITCFWWGISSSCSFSVETQVSVAA
ncbi:hypothetical protein BDR07DRAFT_1494468 [Suillus spraguei]|nr:hypothetical protein BDR07DRAFT_1494468 [Suillus spraguei]